jgi:hypothetical protein
MPLFRRFSRHRHHKLQAMGKSTMRKMRMTKSPLRKSLGKSVGFRACGSIQLEIDLPAFWAWHDHSRASQRAQGYLCHLYQLLEKPHARGERQDSPKAALTRVDVIILREVIGECRMRFHSRRQSL